MTNCHVFEKLKTGPVMPHIIITRNAITKAGKLPVALVILEEKFSNVAGNLFFVFIIIDLKEVFVDLPALKLSHLLSSYGPIYSNN
jgi:hypothetical protein